jgi:hypothetical protein
LQCRVPGSFKLNYLQRKAHCCFAFGPSFGFAALIQHPPIRHNHVTPTSYLELLTTFLKLLAEKRAEITAQKRRLEVGLEKLTSTAKQVRQAGVVG